MTVYSNQALTLCWFQVLSVSSLVKNHYKNSQSALTRHEWHSVVAQAPIGGLGDQHIYKQFFPCNPPQSVQRILNVVAPLHSSALEIDSAQANSQMATLASDHSLAMTNLSTKTSPKQTRFTEKCIKATTNWRVAHGKHVAHFSIEVFAASKKRPKRLQKRQAQSRRYTVLASPE